MRNSKVTRNLFKYKKNIFSRQFAAIVKYKKNESVNEDQDFEETVKNLTNRTTNTWKNNNK